MIRYQIYLDRAGEYRWRLVAANNEIVGCSEGFSTKQAAIDSARWVQRNAASAPIYDLTNG